MDFRPISLCNASYKIIAKILVDRMKCLLPKLVGPEQATFLAGRNIADNTLAAQERATPILMLKLDMGKAYDRECLADYTKLTDQKVNLEKSQLLLPRWIDKEREMMLYNHLGIPMVTVSFTYLGVLISDCRVRVREHQALVDRVGRKLAGWKRGVLSTAGKLTLINATIMAIPTYWLGCTWLPDTILQAIEKKARAFLWESGAGRGLHLQNWNMVMSLKAEGGLAIRKLKEARVALLGKLVFKVLNRQECLWLKIPRAKYRELNP
ncbi:uncharacterized protein [Typha latifolia]|uniref:uncharacterized protein n=1 Tax=Typha latifolia TaxID=4733 RepID=UPI003C2DA042